MKADPYGTDSQFAKYKRQNRNKMVIVIVVMIILVVVFSKADWFANLIK